MTLVTVYWILFLVGLFFAVVSALFVGFGEAMTGHDIDLGAGHDMDLGAGSDVDLGGGAEAAGFDHGGVDMHAETGDMYHAQGEIGVSPVSPATIAAFICGFGGGGLLGYEFGLPGAATILTATPLGFLIGFVVYFSMYKLSELSASSEARASELIGSTAEIITPIVEEGIGEIAYVSRGSRYTSPARSLDGKSIGKAAAVRIWRIVGGTCYVKEIPPEEAEHPSGDQKDVK